MLHNESRKLLIKAYNKTHNAKEVAECFSVNINTVYRLIERMNREGSVDVRTNLRGRKSSLSEMDLRRIKELVQQKPDITLKEIVNTLELKTCIETVRKALVKMGYLYKISSRNRTGAFPCAGRTQKLEQNTSGIKAENFVFLDESGVNTNFTRLYAHAPKSERAVDSAPLNKPFTTTAHTTYQGGTTAQRFYDYIKDILIPSLKKDDVVIMDNMRSHHAKKVTQLFDDKNISYKFLPPYSPDLNPIEKM